jgi:hypothetical protein
MKNFSEEINVFSEMNKVSRIKVSVRRKGMNLSLPNECLSEGEIKKERKSEQDPRNKHKYKYNKDNR